MATASDTISANADAEDRTKLENLSAFSVIFLSIFTITTFVLNLFLIVTIGASRKLRNLVINYLIFNLAVINLLESAVNMVLALLYTAMRSWRMGTFVCNLHSFMIQVVALETWLGLMLLTIDRALCLLSPSDKKMYKQRMTLIRIAVAIGILWLIGGCFAFPILIASIPSAPLPARYLCSVASIVEDARYLSIGYPITILICCYFVPLLITFLAIGVIFHRARVGRASRRTILPGNSNIQTIVDTREFKQQLTLGYFSVALVVIFALLEGPYIILNHYGQIKNSEEVYRDTGTEFIFPKDAETGLTWIKFMYPVIFPFVVAAYCRDLWRKFIGLICCRRTVVRTLTAPGMGGAAAGVHEYDAEGAEFGNDNVPTLVATPGGLHLRTTEYDNQGKPATDKYSYADVSEMSLHNKRRKSEGTSDYDSGDSGSEFNDIPGASTARGTFDRSRFIHYPESEIIDGNIKKMRLEVSVGPSQHNHHHSSSSKSSLALKDKSVIVMTEGSVVSKQPEQQQQQQQEQQVEIDVNGSQDKKKPSHSDLFGTNWSGSKQHKRSTSDGQFSARAETEVQQIDAAKLAHSFDEQTLKRQIWDARTVLNKQNTQDEEELKDWNPDKPSTSKSPLRSYLSKTSNIRKHSGGLKILPSSEMNPTMLEFKNTASMMTADNDCQDISHESIKEHKKRDKRKKKEKLPSPNDLSPDQETDGHLPPINAGQPPRHLSHVTTDRLKFAEPRLTVVDSGAAAPTSLSLCHTLPAMSNELKKTVVSKTERHVKHRESGIMKLPKIITENNGYTRLSRESTADSKNGLKSPRRELKKTETTQSLDFTNKGSKTKGQRAVSSADEVDGSKRSKAMKNPPLKNAPAVWS